MTSIHDPGQANSDHNHDHNRDHNSDHSGNGHEGGIDPHIWLSPPLVRIQADHIRDALIMADTSHKAVYQRNHQAFLNEIDALDGEIRRVLVPFKQMRFMTFHPSWGYFADTYSLVQIPVELEGKEPKPAQLRYLIQQAGELGIQAILVQPQFSTKSAGVIADAVGGRLVEADPMAASWADNLRHLTLQLETILK